MRTTVLTYNGPVSVTVNEGDTVRVHPDTRGTFLPVLRDEMCKAILIENRGTRKKPDVWVLCRAVEDRFNPQSQRREYHERWIGIADLEVHRPTRTAG